MNASPPQSAVKDAILLVAGTGTRLKPLTDNCPKCLLEVGEESLLLRLLRQLHSLGVERVVLATGYLGDSIAAAVEGQVGIPQVACAHNPAYATTNNAESLRQAMPLVEGRSFLLCDGDVLLREADWLGELARDQRENVLSMIANDGMGEEEMKIAFGSNDGPVLERRVVGLSKNLDPRESYGESLGLQKLGASIFEDLLARLEAMSDGERAGSYYEDIFATLIKDGHDFHALPVAAHSWTEIDTVEDLEHARKLYRTWNTSR